LAELSIRFRAGVIHEVRWTNKNMHVASRWRHSGQDGALKQT
jgi:hypothetical protein